MLFLLVESHAAQLLLPPYSGLLLLLACLILFGLHVYWLLCQMQLIAVNSLILLLLAMLTLLLLLLLLLLTRLFHHGLLRSVVLAEVLGAGLRIALWILLTLVTNSIADGANTRTPIGISFLLYLMFHWLFLRLLCLLRFHQILLMLIDSRGICSRMQLCVCLCHYFIE